jgi:hypothetical protein
MRDANYFRINTTDLAHQGLKHGGRRIRLGWHCAAGPECWLRMLGAGESRSFRISFDNPCAKMIAVGDNTELLTSPVIIPHIDINVAERYQVRASTTP